MSDLGGVLGQNSIGEQMQDEEVEEAPVDDAPRAAMPPRPVPGAQWDELHGRWEVWDEATGRWVVVGDGSGDGVEPQAENPLPPLLARELHHAEELAEADVPAVVDVARAAPPTDGPPGAQWNEVLARWERWDDAAGAWVEAVG